MRIKVSTETHMSQWYWRDLFARRVSGIVKCCTENEVVLYRASHSRRRYTATHDFQSMIAERSPTRLTWHPTDEVTTGSIVDTQRQLLHQAILVQAPDQPTTIRHKNDRGTSSPSPPHSALIHDIRSCRQSLVDMTGDSGRSFGPCLWVVGVRSLSQPLVGSVK